MKSAILTTATSPFTTMGKKKTRVFGPGEAYWYACNVIKGRWPQAEDVIRQSPKWAYLYACDVIKGRWPEAEETIRQNPQWAYYYIRGVIKGRWPEAEDVIRQDLRQWHSYTKRFKL